jgi:hypothetical protein
MSPSSGYKSKTRVGKSGKDIYKVWKGEQGLERWILEEWNEKVQVHDDKRSFRAAVPYSLSRYIYYGFPLSTYSSTLKMDAVIQVEMSVNFK